MSGNFHDANYNVTKIRTEDGEVVELELNNKNVPLRIPSPVYAWIISGPAGFCFYTDFPATDELVEESVGDSYFLNGFNDVEFLQRATDGSLKKTLIKDYHVQYRSVEITVISKTQFKIKYTGAASASDTTLTFTRNAEKDLTVW